MAITTHHITGKRKPAALPRANEQHSNAQNAVKQIAGTQAPSGGWRSVLGDSALVASATVVGQVLGALTSLLLRMFLTPAQTGIWQGLKLTLSYGNYSGLGISKAAAREVSLASTTPWPARLAQTVNLAFTVNTLTSLTYAAALIGAALWIGGGGGTHAADWALGLTVMGVMAMLQRYVSFRVTLARADRRFRETALLSMREAVLTLAATAVFVWAWGLIGLYVATAVVMAASLIYLERRSRHRFRFAWHTAEFRRLMRIGGPLLAAGVVSSLFRSLDKLVLLAASADGAFQLGCYSTALLAAVPLYGLANMLSGVIAPRLAQTFGKTTSLHTVAGQSARMTELLTIALALPAALAIVVAPAFLGWLLPEYRAGVPAIVPMIWGTLFVGLALPAQHCLVAWNRGRIVLGLLVIGTVLTLVFDGIAIISGGALYEIALATALANAIYLSLMLMVTLRFVSRKEYRARLLAMTVSLVPVGLATAVALSWSQVGSLVGAIAISTVVVLAWLGIVAFGWRAFRWREFFSRKTSE